MIRQDPNSYIDHIENTYKRGLDYQREKFKQAKHENNYDSMCDSLENIKSEIKIKILQKNNKESLIRIENIINWYRTLESQYIKNTPNGKQVVFPPNIHNKANQALTEAYELLIEQLDILKLL